jgi:hypothetical protein
LFSSFTRWTVIFTLGVLIRSGSLEGLNTNESLRIAQLRLKIILLKFYFTGCFNINLLILFIVSIVRIWSAEI